MSEDSEITHNELDPTQQDDGRQGDMIFDAQTICEDFLRIGMTGDKYRVLGKVGQGGMGAVFKVIDEGLKRVNVLKVLAADMMDSPQYLKRFVDEARITGVLEHPNIIPVHDLGVVDRNKIYFSMKYIEGEELGDLIRKLRRGDEEATSRFSLYILLTIFRKVCDAVGFAHSRGIIHRDIKPDNVMVARYGEVMLVDWGLARYENDDRDEGDDEDVISAMSDSSSLKTRDGMIKGTPAYMAPEQASGIAGAADKRTDIFLLGSTLYAIATLNPPYTGDDIYDILDNAEEGNFQHPAERAPERQIPEELCRLIMRAMAVDPNDRYQTVEELADDIDVLMEGKSVSLNKSFRRGEILMREGETGSEAYMILSGKVEVIKTIRGKPVVVVTLSEGDTVGEMAMISDAPRSATVRAVEDTEVVVITEELIRKGLDKLPPWMGKTVTAMVERLRQSTAQMHPLASGDCSCHVVNQLRLIYPYWGIPAQFEDDVSVIAISVEGAISEVAANLCLSKARVANVIAKLFDSQLLHLVGEDHFVIPNYQIFCRFADFLRDKYGIESAIWRDQRSQLFVSPSKVAVSHVDANTLVLIDDELVEAAQAPPEEFLDVTNPDAIRDTFESLYSDLSKGE